MKKSVFYFLILLSVTIFNSCFKEGCKDKTANNYDAKATKDCSACCLYSSNPTNPTPTKGALLFWTNDANLIPTCGILTVRLNNGQQTNVTGYYLSSPSNCLNQVGGYFYLNEGTYTYQVIPGNSQCNTISGSVTVVGGTCNFARI